MVVLFSCYVVYAAVKWGPGGQEIFSNSMVGLLRYYRVVKCGCSEEALFGNSMIALCSHYAIKTISFWCGSIIYQQYGIIILTLCGSKCGSTLWWYVVMMGWYYLSLVQWYYMIMIVIFRGRVQYSRLWWAEDAAAFLSDYQQPHPLLYCTQSTVPILAPVEHLPSTTGQGRL